MPRRVSCAPEPLEARPTEKRRHIGAIEMVDADFAGERQKRDVAFDRRSDIEVSAEGTGFAKLVVDEVVGGGEGREIRIA